MLQTCSGRWPWQRQGNVLAIPPPFPDFPGLCGCQAGEFPQHYSSNPGKSLQGLPVAQVSHGWEQEEMQDLRARRVEDLRAGRAGSRMDGGPGSRRNGGPGNRRDGGPGHWKMPKTPSGFPGGSKFTAQLHWPLSGLLSKSLLELTSMGEARRQCQPLPKSPHCHPNLPLFQGSSQPLLLLPPWGRIWMPCLFLIYAKLKKKYIFFNY